MRGDTPFAVMMQTLDLLTKVCRAAGQPCPTIPVSQDTTWVTAIGILAGNPPLVEAANNLINYVSGSDGNSVRALDALVTFLNEANKPIVVAQLIVLGYDSTAVTGIAEGLSQFAIAYRMGSTLGKVALYALSPLSGSITFIAR